MAPSIAGRQRHRRWPWFLGGAVLLIGAGLGVIWLTSSRAIPVTMQQAESRLGRSRPDPSDLMRPAPGVYRYTGSGTESLTLPPLTQAEGPTMPGTLTLRGANCWDFRIDYSTHHWRTWDYCLDKGGLRETGGRLWQLWPIGPVNMTNVTSITCSSGTMAFPTEAVPGQHWVSRCTGDSTAVKGRMVSTGPYRFVGDVTILVGGHPVRAARFLALRTDSGAQRGTERSEVWFRVSDGLPLRLRQDIKVTTSTPFGTSTYTQVGVFSLVSSVPHR